LATKVNYWLNSFSFLELNFCESTCKSIDTLAYTLKVLTLEIGGNKSRVRLFCRVIGWPIKSNLVCRIIYTKV